MVIKFHRLKPHAADPSKILKILRNSGFPWALGFVNYRSSLSYLHYLCLAPWIPRLLAPWLPCSVAGSVAPWLAGCLAPGRLGPREARKSPRELSGAQDVAPSPALRRPEALPWQDLADPGSGGQTHGTAATELFGRGWGELFGGPPPF